MKMSPTIYQILKTIDIKAAAKFYAARIDQFGEPARPDVVEAAIHKARIKAGRVFTAREREVSRQWLEANGYQVPDS